MISCEEILKYAEDNTEAALNLLLELAPIPAPSHHEELRAEFCKKWLESIGAEGVYIDEALNVVFPYGDISGDIKVFMAHSDVVFPDTEPLPLKREDGKIYCPGIGDDTAHAVTLMMAAKYIVENKPECDNCGILIVINSCEEGLGNLKGCRHIMEKFGDRVTEFVTFDSHPKFIANGAVGSHRYKIEVKTAGGHSFGNFGRTNSIAVLAQLINKLYSVTLPENGRTTYNVGTISGGTSVNTIAQNAEMLYEYRSNKAENLEYMQNQLAEIVDSFKELDAEITVTKVGDRPCGSSVDEARHKELTDKAVKVIEKIYEITPRIGSGSTDCNVPLSMGIPSVCVGCVKSSGAHTRREYMLEESLEPGIAVALSMINYSLK